MLILTLIQNIALLVALSVAYGLVLRSFERRSAIFQVLAGLLFGGVGIIGMMTPLRFAPGVIYDGRSIVLTVAGLFGGPLVAAAAAAMCSAYRLWLGGAGAWVGIAVIVEAAVLGSALHLLRQRDRRWERGWALLGLAFLVHAIMLALQLLIPGGVGRDVIRQLGWAILIFYPLATFVVCQVFLERERHLAAEQALRASETRYRTTLLSVGDAVIVTDTDGRVEMLNPTAERLTGWPSQEARGRPVTEVLRIVNEETGELAQNPVARVLREGVVAGLANHILLIARDGSQRPIAGNAAPIRNDAGQITGMVLAFRDQTEERAAQWALQREKGRAEQYLDVVGVMMIALDINGHITLVNRKACEVLGYTEDELLGKNWFDCCLPGQVRNQVREVFGQIISGQLEPVGYYENPVVTRTGEERIIAWHNAILRDEHGAIVGTLSSGEDITDRLQAEEARRHAEARYRTLVEQLPAITYIVEFGESNRTIYISPQVQSLLGFSPDEWLADPDLWIKQLHPEDRERVLSEVRLRDARGEPLDIEYRVLTRDGRVVWVRNQTALLRDQEGRIRYSHGVMLDITERKLAEDALAESELRYRTTLDSIGDAIHVVDASLRITLFNLAFRKWAEELGLDTEVIGRPLFDVFPFLPDRVRDEYRQVFERAETLITEEATQVGDKEFITETRKIPICEGGRVTRVITIVRDITERRRAEEELRRRTAQLEALRQVSLELTAQLNLDELLHSIVSLSVSLLDGSAGAFERYRPDLDMLEWAASVNVEHPPPKSFLRRGEGLAGKVWEKGAPLIIEDYQHWEGRVPGWEDSQFQAVIGVPVRWGEEFLGVLEVNAAPPRTFSPHDAELLSLLATQAAIAIRNATLYEQIQTHTRYLEALQQINATLRSTLPLSQVLDTIARSAAEALNFIAALILVPNATGEQLILGSAWGGRFLEVVVRFTGLRVSSFRLPLSATENPMARAYLSGQLTIWSRAPERIVVGVEPHISPKLAAVIERAMGAKTAVCLPLPVGDRIVGVLVAFSPREYLSQDERAVLLSIADQAGLAIENARLYEQTLRRAEESAHLLEIARTLSAHVPLPTLLQQIAEHARTLLNASSSGMYLYDAAHEELEVAVAVGSLMPLGTRLRLGEGMAGRVALTRQPMLVDDYSTWEGRAAAYEGMPIRAVVEVPMIFAGELLGVLVVQETGDSQRKFTQEDVYLLSLLAAQAAAAIHNARLYEQAQVQAQQLAQIMHSVPQGVLLLDPEGRLLLANELGQQYVTQLSDAVVGQVLTRLGGRPLEELLTSPPPGQWHEIRVGSRIFEAIARPVVAGPAPSGWVLVLRDVTQERTVQQQLQRQERLAAIGQLAAGIAHDFRNTLAVITLYAPMVARSPNLSERDRERVTAIHQQALQASRLIEQILDFSRRGVIQREPLDLLDLLQEQVQLLRRTLPEHVQITLDSSPGEYLVMADRTRIQQMVMNLALNARDAMPEGGSLRFELAQIRVERGKDAPLPGMAPGMWLRLRVADTGTGMPPEVLEHLFEPFFTTKEPGRGTGLGLAQVHGIVGQHGGHITVETQVGAGTTFTIYLPAIETSSQLTSAPELTELPQGHGESVLIVEDNSSLRTSLAEFLQALHYQTHELTNGEEALAFLAQGEQEIDLVLSDVVMPHMGGVALVRALRAQGSKVPVILLSGHPLEEQPKDADALAVSAWLFKPPEPRQLAEAIAQALQAAPRPSA